MKETEAKKKKGGQKQEKEGPKGYPPRRAQKLIFHIRTVKKNRNEIEDQKNQILSPERKRKKKKKKKKNGPKKKKKERKIERKLKKKRF